MSRFESLALLFVSAVMCSAFVGAGIWFVPDTRVSGAPVAVQPGRAIEAQIDETIAYLQTSPKDGDAMKRLGRLYAEAGRLKEAVSAYVSASMELPGDSEIKRALIELQARAQQKGKH